MYLVRPNTLYKVNCYPTQRVVLWNGVPGTPQILCNGSYCTLRHNASYKKCYPIEQFRLMHATLCFPCECCFFWYCLTEGRLLFVCSTVLGGWCKTECYCANLIFVFFLHNRNLRPRNFTLESAWIRNKSCLPTKLCVKVYTVCTAVFLRSNWRILHMGNKNLHNQMLWWFWQISGILLYAVEVHAKAPHVSWLGGGKRE